jgi:hypothetical protein
MNKILNQGNWYNLVSSNSVYEISYENQILRFSKDIFPGFYCSKFKIKVNSVFGNCIPDLVLVHKEYKDWYVVEVELEHHSLGSHVADQIRSMHYGEYGSEHGKYLLKEIPGLDQEKVAELIKQKPKTLVIVPISKISWRESLYQYQTKIMCIEVWEDDKGIPLLRIDGDLPESYEEKFITELEIDRSLNRLLKVKNTGSIPAEGKMQIDISGRTSEWRIISTSAGKWLNPDGKWPLPEGANGVFSLKISDTGEYVMESKNG